MVAGHNGTLTGTASYSPTQGRIRGAVDFTNGKVAVAPTATLNNIPAMTVCAWVYPRSFPVQFPIIVDKSSANDGSDGWNFYLRNINTFGLYVNSGDYKERATVTLNSWQHLCGTWDGTATTTGIKLYRNGAEATTGGEENTLGAALDDSAFPLNIGSSGFGSAYMDGLIDDVRIYNRVLSDAEILLLYQADDPGGSCVLPDATEGQMRYNLDCNILQYCNGGDWVRMGDKTVDPCTCGAPPAIGDVCRDGTIYAGLTPDGNVRMYTTPADEGMFAWNNGNTSGYVNTAIADCTTASPSTQAACVTGEANTLALSTIDSNSASGGVQPHRAAQRCANLSAYGHDDWYLPAQEELYVLYTNRNAGALSGTFDLSGTMPNGYYQSSSEDAGSTIRYLRFSNGSQFLHTKDKTFSVRCVRK